MSLVRNLTVIILAFGGVLSVNAAEPVKVGILGLDNYQSIEHAAFFNNPKAEENLSGLRVSVVYPVTSPDYPKSAESTQMWLGHLQNQYKGDPNFKPIEIVNSMDEFLARCDGVMIWTLATSPDISSAIAEIT